MTRGNDFALPPYPYVPGRNARHESFWFDAAIDSVHDGMTSDELAETLAWRGGWRCYDAGYFWEAHELFEAVWLRTAPNSCARFTVVAVIQLANARLKARMGRVRAVHRLTRLAQEHVDNAKALGGPVMGVTESWLCNEIAGLEDGVL